MTSQSLNSKESHEPSGAQGKQTELDPLTFKRLQQLVFHLTQSDELAEWQLPGYDRLMGKSRTSNMAQPASLPKNPPRNETQKQAPPGQPQQLSTPRNGTSVRGVIGQTRAASRPSRVRGSPGGRQLATPRNSGHFFKDSPAKANWRNGLQPNVLPRFFGSARRITSGRGSHITQGRHEVFEEISKKTGAFVKPPAYTDQVAAAKDELQRIIAKCNGYSASAPKKKLEWAKIYAHSVNKEADVELNERRESILQQLRKAPEDPSAFPEQLLFLWPREGPPLLDSLGPQLEVLDVMRARFGCHLFVPSGMPNYICALGHSQGTMKQLVHRLRTKWTELVANSNVKSKVYVVEPPAPKLMKEGIVIKRSKQFGKPFLDGAHPKDLEQWEIRAALIQSKNNARLLSAVERSLGGVAFVRGHLRMRINLGSFVLDEYRLPKDDQPSYSFEEFREMLLHEQTKGRLIPGLKIGKDQLLAECFGATDILEHLDGTSGMLKAAEPAFSVNFEFLGSNNALLRLEAEFAKSPGAFEYEITQRRWLRPRGGGRSADNQSPLQIGAIGFERSDWQLEIKALEFYETSSIDAALKLFSHSINFRRTANIDDISAKPQRKVLFPHSAPVARFVEKTAIRYRLKGTKYILEIARYDEYSRTTVPAYRGQNPPTVIGAISEVPSTSWGASIFDPNWDNLLGQHANLPVGHTARYTPTLSTFFPPKEQTAAGKCVGFWELIDLVRQVAGLFGTSTAPSEDSQPQNPKSPKSDKSGDITAARQRRQQINIGPQKRVLLEADLGTLF
ncbi:uncharacterized protein ACLA_024790 [Aspergillus clavatus NRRL 1]|uniref:DUF7905 domain-containing protein n=1 Tax=Aspergillus clavatus (strain ATCC 1007 / CBS 513.65 / DSM 816 / NCTC 3887 / NRRL 1 / QM 1276 / 107) TaxID=344612 RepID=A1CQ42_ASPCL|nr:uncharacterized protein ACLA_024790 [Aspergillus clavatus NRRL 1]EAW07763.1 conserved hypothetical protein [Aspergillus clavatus NRRL 1]